MIRAAAAAFAILAGCGPSPDVPGIDPPDAGAPPDAEPPDAHVPDVPREIDGRITINEVMASNAMTVPGEAGEAADWIELHNPNDQAISLHGYRLTDDLTEPAKHVFGAGVTVPPRGHLVLWLDNQPGMGPTHVGFKLGREAGEVGLGRPDGSWIDRVRYGEQAVDFSAAREPDGSDHWVIEWHPSPGAANPTGPGTPVGLENPDAPPEMVPAAGDLSEQILGYDVFLELGLEVPPESAAALAVEPYVYVPASLVYQGRSYGPVGLRLKGQNSFQPFHAKPSFRINVDEYVDSAKFFGLDDLTLNNMSDDLSMMHERLAYRVMREAGVPASRANHGWITVNGQAYGLYINVETVKREMIGRWFDDDQGSLFEGTNVDFVASYIPDYELEFGPDDRSLLHGVANAMNIPGATAAIASAGQYANLDQLRRYWAAAAVVAQFDAFPYSIPGDDYFVYADPTSGKLHFLPWGMDETFLSGSHPITNPYSILADRCKEAPACWQAWIDEVWEVLAVTEDFDLAAARTAVANQIAPYVTMDLKKPYTDQQVFASQQDLFWFIDGRRENISAMLAPASP